jgi:hypothetical protein
MTKATAAFKQAAVPSAGRTFKTQRKLVVGGLVSDSPTNFSKVRRLPVAAGRMSCMQLETSAAFEGRFSQQQVALTSPRQSDLCRRRQWRRFARL